MSDLLGFGADSGTSSGSGSSILSRLRLAVMAGMSFGTLRDYYQTFGYTRKLNAEYLLARYERQDIVARIVDMPAEDMWSNFPSLNVDGEGAHAQNEPEIRATWLKVTQRLRLWDRLIQADKLCNFGPFAVLWLGLPGLPQSAAGQISSMKEIKYVQAHGGDAVRVKSLDTNITSPRFGQPLMYEITLSQTTSGLNVSGVGSDKKEVHYTRIVHITDRPLQGNLSAVPRLHQINNLLDDLLKIAGGSAETFWLTSNRGMQVDIDKEMQLSEPDEQALSDELDEYQHQLRRYIRTRGVKIQDLGSQTTDPGNVFRTTMALLSAATNIPQRILSGAEAGQLASEQDRANWSDYLQRRRKVYAEPYALIPLLERLEALGLFPKETVERVTFEWPSAFRMSPIEEAQSLASIARAVNNFSIRNRFGDPIISDEEGRRFLKLPAARKEGDTFPKKPDPSAATGAGMRATDSGTQGSSNSNVDAGNSKRQDEQQTLA